MENRTFSVQPAVKKETLKVLLYTVIGTLLMWIVLFILNRFVIPDSVPFDYTVFLAGACGCAVAVLNFFIMGLTVQKVAATDDEKRAASIMRLSMTYRSFFQIFWIAAAILAPCFYWIAGVAPLLFPSFGIKIAGIFGPKKKNTSGQEVDTEQNGD
ncbi:MAG: hypothetical protein ILP13_05300 [Lachnospiraceae bacterium]|nr:hypothetical protein [Lachnospiraceae bacterium]